MASEGAIDDGEGLLDSAGLPNTDVPADAAVPNGEGALNENTPGVVLDVDGVAPKLKVVLPDVDVPAGVDDTELPKPKEDLFSVLAALATAALNGLSGVEVSVEDVEVAVLNGEALLPVVPNAFVKVLDFPNADGVPNAGPVVPNAGPVVPYPGVPLFVLVPGPKLEEVATLEVPPPKFEAGFTNGEPAAPVGPIAVNPVLLAASFDAELVFAGGLVTPKVYFGAVAADTPLKPVAFDVLVPVDDAPAVGVNGLKLNNGVDVSFFSAGVVVVIEAVPGVVVAGVAAVVLLKLKENFGVVVAPATLGAARVVVVGAAAGVAVGNALIGAEGGTVDVSGFAKEKMGFVCGCTGGVLKEGIETAGLLPKTSFFCSEVAPEGAENEKES